MESAVGLAFKLPPDKLQYFLQQCQEKLKESGVNVAVASTTLLPAEDSAVITQQSSTKPTAGRSTALSIAAQPPAGSSSQPAGAPVKAARGGRPKGRGGRHAARPAPAGKDALMPSSASPRRKVSAARGASLFDELEMHHDGEGWGSVMDQGEAVGGDESGWETARGKNKLAKRPRFVASSPRKSPAPAAASNKTTVPRVSPLVLEGLSDTDKTNDLLIAQLLGTGRSLVKRTQRSKAGTVLVLPKSMEAREQLLQLKLRDGLVLRPTLGSTRQTARRPPVVILTGVHPSVDVEQLAAECGRKCTRLVSAKLNAPTWKVKVVCTSTDDRAALLKSGLSVGLERHRCTEYVEKPTLLQCYQCQSFGHLAAKCTAVQKCRKCGEAHDSRECAAEAIKCANCQGPHTASDFSCPAYQSAQLKKQSSVMSYAAAARKSGDQVECVRLACTIDLAQRHP